MNNPELLCLISEYLVPYKKYHFYMLNKENNTYFNHKMNWIQKWDKVINEIKNRIQNTCFGSILVGQDRIYCHLKPNNDSLFCNMCQFMSCFRKVH